MGDVFLGEDVRLGRTVALKFLPEKHFGDPTAQKRFEREARAASALNHPNICTVYDVGEHENQPFIVMEHLEGRTLLDRLNEGPLPLEEILNLGMQIADALEAAHSRGIIHRDVKPANIFITDRGDAKVLDFGLAKFAPTLEPADSQPTMCPEDSDQPGVDLSAPQDSLTRAGTAMGTYFYMSPEQALGKDLDARSDLFSLGIVVYLMAAGDLPFQGPTAAALFDEILHKPTPPLREVNPSVPLELEQIVCKALEKDKEVRYQSAREMRVDLRRLKRDTASVQIPARTIASVSRPPSGKKRVVLWSSRALVLVAILGVVLTGLLASWLLWRESGDAPAPMRTVPFTASLPGRKLQPAVSPDGRQVAFVWNGEKGGDNFDLYVKLVGAGSPLRLTVEPGYEVSPTWSPDGRYLAFLRYSPDNSGIFTIPALSGSERKLASLENHPFPLLVDGLDWSPDGRFLVFEDAEKGGPTALHLLEVENRRRRRLSNPPDNSFGDWHPRFSPDGRTVAFTRARSKISRINDVFLVDVVSGKERRLTVQDLGLVEGLDWSRDGRELIFASTLGGNSGIWRISVSGGSPRRLPLAAANSAVLSIAAADNLLAYMESFEDLNVWRLPIGPATESVAPEPFLSSTRMYSAPQLSPDGSRLAYASSQSGSPEVWISNPDGSVPVQLTEFETHLSFSERVPDWTATPHWSPDGGRIAFDQRFDGQSDIVVISPDGTVVRRLTEELSEEVLPSWSSSGDRLYFASDRSGDWQIWKIGAEGGEWTQVTRQGGFKSMESFDGRHLYYSRYDQPGIWKVPTQGGDESKVLEKPNYWGLWTLERDGIFFVDLAKECATIEFLNFSSGAVERTAELPHIPYRYGSVLSISPNQQFLLYTQLDQQRSDIFLIENFR